jgi:hypothetical protein
VAYEIRAMTLGEILDTSFRLIRDHFGPLVGMAAALYVPYYVMLTLLQLSFMSNASQEAAASMGATIAGFAGAILTVMIVGPIVFAAIYHALSESYVGRPVQIQASLKEAVRIVLPLLGTSIIATLGAAAFSLLLIIPGIWFFLGTTVLVAINVVERSFGIPAIRRSLDLMKGHRGRAFLLYVLVAIVSAVITGAFSFLGFVSPWIGAIGQGLAMAVTAVFSGAMTIVLYFDIRCRKEAFDVEHLARLVQSGAAA